MFIGNNVIKAFRAGDRPAVIAAECAVRGWGWGVGGGVGGFFSVYTHSGGLCFWTCMTSTCLRRGTSGKRDPRRLREGVEGGGRERGGMKGEERGGRRGREKGGKEGKREGEGRGREKGGREKGGRRGREEGGKGRGQYT